MKEIDFLPEWYKNDKRRQVSYRTQYIAISSVFVVMMLWGFIASRSISKARGQIAELATKQNQAEIMSAKYAGIENEIKALRKKAGSIEKIDSKIDVASVLAEMSFLIDERIVLKKLEFIAEKFANEQENNKSPGVDNVVRVVPSNIGNKKELPLGNVRFKVVIVGIAADTNDVAALMCKLEDSPYFGQVVLSYSRGNEEIGMENKSSFGTGEKVTQQIEQDKNQVSETVPKGKIQVIEFEINCYLANYREL